MPNRRKALAVAGGVLVVALFGGVEAAIVRSYNESARSTRDFSHTVDSTTFLANVQREFYLYERALLESPPQRWDEGEAADRRMFLQRQIDLLARTSSSDGFQENIRKIRIELSHLNKLIRIGDQVAGGRELKEEELLHRLRRLELEIKHTFDAEELILLGTVGKTMEGRESSQRTLAVLAGFVFVIAALVALAFARSVRSRLSLAYEAQARTLKEKERVAVHLAESLASLEKAQVERENFLDTLFASVEEERVRIAGELHDRPIQQLTALNYDLALTRLCFEEGDMSAGLEELDGFEQKLSEQIDGLRKLMSELRPPALDQAGLIGALQDHVADFERRAKVSCSIEAELDVRPDPTIETVLYRVAQEALTNVMKHARADRVELSLKQEDGAVVLRVRDNGVGFEATSMTGGRDHFGMSSMRRRVDLAGGHFSVSTMPNQGTEVVAEFNSDHADLGRVA